MVLAETSLSRLDWYDRELRRVRSDTPELLVENLRLGRLHEWQRCKELLDG